MGQRGASRRSSPAGDDQPQRNQRDFNRGQSVERSVAPRHGRCDRTFCIRPDWAAYPAQTDRAAWANRCFRRLVRSAHGSKTTLFSTLGDYSASCVELCRKIRHTPNHRINPTHTNVAILEYTVMYFSLQVSSFRGTTPLSCRSECKRSPFVSMRIRYPTASQRHYRTCSTAATLSAQWRP